VSNRLNEVMKRLTVVSTIFLPIAFIVGLGGMNFQQFPFGSDVVYWTIMASLIAVPAFMLLYFRIKGWY
ncbi:MAG TPA: CorA family divalent cation transporter, partial [Anaeromyxobacter sp.]